MRAPPPIPRCSKKNSPSLSEIETEGAGGWVSRPVQTAWAVCPTPANRMWTFGQCVLPRPSRSVDGEMHHSRSHISSRPRLSLPWLLSRKNFTPQEVRQRLQVETTHDERTRQVHAAAARTAVWSSRLPDRLAFELGRAAHRLPSVVYWYRQGLSMHDIGRRLSPFGGAWDANRALDTAATLIADALNSVEVLNTLA